MYKNTLKNAYGVKGNKSSKTKKATKQKHRQPQNTLSFISSLSKSDDTIENKTNYDDISNSDFSRVSIRFTSGKFYTKTKTAYHIKRKPLVKDKFIDFLDDYTKIMIKGKVITGDLINENVFQDNKLNCICENIFNEHLKEECNCKEIITYPSQGKSGAKIHAITCEIPNIGQIKNVLKVMPLSEYYLKFKSQTEKYIYLQADRFTIQTLINRYVFKELPNNCVNIRNSGICRKNKFYGYNLMEEANLGTGITFLKKLIDGKYDSMFEIMNSQERYEYVSNFLIQCVLIIGHLQSSSLEFFHGDYKPENVFVKSLPVGELSHFDFMVYGKKMKVKNLGFAVLIADFDLASVSFNPENLTIKKKYRIVPPIKFSPLLNGYVNEFIESYADIDPDEKNFKDLVVNKLFISKIIPKKIDPLLSILRASGLKLFRDFDLYIFFIKLLDNKSVKNYIIEYKLDKIILAFMSDKFITKLFSYLSKLKENYVFSVNEACGIAVNILNDIKEPMPRIFDNEYIKTLNLINYRLFK